MDIINLQNDEALRLASSLTMIVCSLIVIAFFIAVRNSRLAKQMNLFPILQLY